MQPHLIVSAPRGSGGAYRQLAHIVARLPALRPEWRIQVYAAPEAYDALRDCRGIERHCLSGSRLAWEFVGLPGLCRANPSALVYAPFGPVVNLTLAPRTVWMTRNIIPLLAPAKWEVSSRDELRLRVLRQIAVMNARHARKVICVSEHARRALARLTRLPITSFAVVQHGADDPDGATAELPPPLAGAMTTPYLLHVGQPVPYRRTLDLADAYAQLATRRNDLPRLVMVGSPRSEDRRYAQLCARRLAHLIAKGQVVQLGQQPRSVVLALTRKAEAIVYPSVHEDCPNVVLEALYARRPLVCADIPATRELAGETGALYVRDPRATALARAIERIVTDPDLRLRLAAAAGERSSLFTWDKAAHATADVLARAMK